MSYGDIGDGIAYLFVLAEILLAIFVPLGL